MEKNKNFLKEYLTKIYKKSYNGIFISGNSGYWSNLSKEKNNEFSEILKKNDCKTAVKSFMPKFEEMIFSTKREAALELLNHEKRGLRRLWFNGRLKMSVEWQKGHQFTVDQT